MAIYLGVCFMHMADALLSPAVGVTMCAVSAGAVAYSAAKVKKDELGEKKLPVMAVAGAFVFASQMINFTIPATGSSGHIGGGVLLAAMLGGYPALLTIAAVLVIQCLFFADGGLLALGCNIFNLGVIPCLLVYPLLFRRLTRTGLSGKTLSTASILSTVVGLELGAFCVVLETLASGITLLPFFSFAALMLPIHLAIGLVEGLVTAAVLTFVHKLRPEILDSTGARGKIAAGVPMKKVLAVLVIVTLLVAGGLSLFASAYPDGLEWSMEKLAGTAELAAGGGLFDRAAAIQERTAFMPDYNYAGAGEEDSPAGTAAAGLVGSLMTFALAGAAGLAIKLAKQKKGRDASA